MHLDFIHAKADLLRAGPQIRELKLRNGRGARAGLRPRKPATSPVSLATKGLPHKDAEFTPQASTTVPPAPFEVYLSLTNWNATAVRAAGAL